MLTWAIYTGLLAGVTFLYSGCHPYQVIPDALGKQVNERLTFEQIKRDPSRFRGQTVVLGGEVLSATRLPNHTRIEVLQMPLSEQLVPAGNRSLSRGRFLAFDEKGDIVDPAILPEGTRVTIVGDLQRPVSEHLDESDYVYPTILIRDMTVWHLKPNVPLPGGALIGPYWGAYNYYGIWPYPYWAGTRVAG